MENLTLNNINYNRDTFLPLAEERFWEMVDQSNWYELCKRYGRKATEIFAKQLSLKYDINEIAEMQRNEVDKRDEILDFIKDFVAKMPQEEKSKYTLDSLESIDLASYIVGLGRTMYNYVKDNPNIILDLQNRDIVCFEDGFDKAIYAINFVN